MSGAGFVETVYHLLKGSVEQIIDMDVYERICNSKTM